MSLIFGVIHQPKFPPDLVLDTALPTDDFKKQLIVYVGLFNELWVVKVVFSQVFFEQQLDFIS